MFPRFVQGRLHMLSFPLDVKVAFNDLHNPAFPMPLVFSPALQ
jgi:hypothetical protein